MSNMDVMKSVSVDEYYSDVTIKTAGEDEILRFAKQALKAQVEEILIERLKGHSFKK